MGVYGGEAGIPQRRCVRHDLFDAVEVPLAGLYLCGHGGDEVRGDVELQLQAGGRHSVSCLDVSDWLYNEEEGKMSDRDVYVEKMKAKLDEWNAEIDKLQAQAKAAEADAKADYEKQLAEMRHQRNEAQAKLKDAQDASDAAWDDMRKGMENAWESISSSFQSAMNRFR